MEWESVGVLSAGILSSFLIFSIEIAYGWYH